MLAVKVFVIGVWIVLAEAQNYCASNLCPNGLKHIACGNSGNFAAKCPSNARMVDLGPYKQIIVDSHNEKRNLIASGKMPRYDSASRMATMQWDAELAKIAAFNVKQCVVKHDACRNTQNFSYSGQNIGMLSYNGPLESRTDEYIVKNRIDSWWSENKDANMSIIRKYPKNYSGPAIGHFTVMAADRNIRVGCAAIRLTENNFNRFIITCNYATTNIFDKPIYSVGKPASGCTVGSNTKYTSLCGANEKYSGL